MMKFVLTNVVLMLSLTIHSQPKIFPEDIDIILGEWEGSITYLDYQTNKPFTMPANLTVEWGKNKRTLVLKNYYPNEPKANNKGKINISKKGFRLNRHKVTSRSELENGQIHIQTEHRGKDDKKKALIRYSYIMDKSSFTIKKEVQFDESEAWIKRSEFNYTRKE